MAAHARRDTSSSFEIALVLVRFDDLARFIVNANNGIVERFLAIGEDPEKFSAFLSRVA